MFGIDARPSATSTCRDGSGTRACSRTAGDRNGQSQERACYRVAEDVKAFIQARMSSRRFPGKVLAPFQGRPLIRHVVERVARALPAQDVIVATSTHPSDDPLACYLQDKGIICFRGPLDDVVARFQACLQAHPCDRFFRISADSPLIDPALVGRLMEEAAGDEDLVTNVFPRTFPPGQSLELIRSATFSRLEAEELSPEQREHVTLVFYDHPERYTIRNVRAPGPSGEAAVVDTVEDLQRLEARQGQKEPGRSAAAGFDGGPAS